MCISVTRVWEGYEIIGGILALGEILESHFCVKQEYSCFNYNGKAINPLDTAIAAILAGTRNNPKILRDIPLSVLLLHSDLYSDLQPYSA